MARAMNASAAHSCGVNGMAKVPTSILPASPSPAPPVQTNRVMLS